MTIRTTRKTTFIALAERVALVRRERPLPSSPLKVSLRALTSRRYLLRRPTDAKQARDLVSVLTESKQQIDPRLAEMARYGGGGGGGRGFGGGRGRGRGGHGGHGGGFTASNAAPLGRSRW